MLHSAMQRLLCAWRTASALDRVAGGAGAETTSVRRAVRRAAAACHRQRRRCLSAARRRRRGRGCRPHQGVPVRSGSRCGCCCRCGERGTVTGITLLRPVTATSLSWQRRRSWLLTAAHVSWGRRVISETEADGRFSQSDAVDRPVDINFVSLTL